MKRIPFRISAILILFLIFNPVSVLYLGGKIYEYSLQYTSSESDRIQLYEELYPALSAIGMKIWQKYQEMEKGYRAVSKRGTVTAIVSAVSTAAKIAAAALTVVGTICTTGSIAAGLEAGKRLIYA